jgi:hypothetical protein
MALKKNKDGTFQIKTVADATEAVARAREYKAEIKDIMNDTTELSRAAARFLHEKGISEVELEDGSTVKVVQRHNRFWAATDDDVPDGIGARSLRSIIGDRKTGKGKKVWNFITKRVIDEDKLDIAVGRGYITEDEIAPALIEKPQSPYLQGL